MTDDEIRKLSGLIFYRSNYNEAIEFARAIESHTLAKQKAKWYQEGVEAEREACAEICELLKPSNPEFDRRFWDGCNESANAIRARGAK